MNREALLERFESINVWKRGDQRAPHKPLLLLLALGRLQDGSRMIPYAEIDQALRTLLEDFGPPRRTHHPEYPFWRLQNDGLWTLSSSTGLERRKSNSDPTRRALLDHDIAGGFPTPLYDTLSQHPALVNQIALQLLDEHFPASMHQDILDAVGLTLQATRSTRRKRDASFRERILRTYAYRCAVCGFDMRLDNRTIGLEAAHVKWHQAGGPDVEQNGVALCTMHHKLFDRGAFRINSDYRILISERVNGSSGLENWLLQHHASPLHSPQRDEYRVEPNYLSWHRKEVFKGPDRV